MSDRNRRQEPPPNAEGLPPPAGPALAAIRAHVKEHGIKCFQLERHVHLGGPREETQLITWMPANAVFRCNHRECVGFVYGTGEVTDEMVARAQRFDPGLQSHLAGIHDPADRAELTRLYLSGDWNQERLRGLRSAGPRRRSRAGKRPEVEERKRRVQAWMLDRYRERGVAERVFDEAELMSPDEWLKLAFRPALARSTLRSYWHDIDPNLRQQARQQFEKRQRNKRRKSSST